MARQYLLFGLHKFQPSLALARFHGVAFLIDAALETLIISMPTITLHVLLLTQAFFLRCKPRLGLLLRLRNIWQ